jgi:hypothetical protein
MHDDYDTEEYYEDEDEDDVLGFLDEDDDDDEDDDVLGLSLGGLARAIRGRVAPRRRPRRGTRVSVRRPRRRPRRGTVAVRPRGVRTVRRKPSLVSATPGVPEASKLYLPLGLGSFTFVNAGVTINTFTTNPQKPIIPRRLWIDVVRTSGAAGIAVNITDIKIGTKSMLAGLLAIPASQFAANAFARSYNVFDSATPGLDVAVFVSLSAGPGVGETVTVTVSMDVETIG